MTISLIVAKSLNNVIGINNKLPWRIPYDLAFFKMITEGKTVLMGRKCLESIGKPLPNRINIVLSRNKDLFIKGACICNNVQAVLDQYKHSQDSLFVIGGEEIYKAFLPHVEYIYMTEILREFDGDAYFPEINYDDWTVEWEAKGVTNEQNMYDYYFTKYKKKLDK